MKSSSVPLTVAAYRLAAARPSNTPCTSASPRPARSGTALFSPPSASARFCARASATPSASPDGGPRQGGQRRHRHRQGRGLRPGGVRFVSCPTCGRTEIDLISLATEVEKRVGKLDRDITVAVMGCVVNGPGEAREADYGIAGGKGAGAVVQERSGSRYISV